MTEIHLEMLENNMKMVNKATKIVQILNFRENRVVGHFSFLTDLKFSVRYLFIYFAN